MQRRHFLHTSLSVLASSSLTALQPSLARAAQPQDPAVIPPARLQVGGRVLAPILASPERIIEMNVCTRPFRPQGPRIEIETLGRKSIVHNYGHGGSGWSLSWGSGSLAVGLAQNLGNQQIAVIGCGAIGMTTALVAQRAGLSVTIYARELPPYVRSNFATGAWTPDSRICSAEYAGSFANRWESMARHSFRHFQSLLGLPGDPIEWRDMYSLQDAPFGVSGGNDHESMEPEYPDFSRDLIADITPASVDIASTDHPFPAAHVRRRPAMLFNISSYSRLLLSDFLQSGGRLVTRELKNHEDFANLDEDTIINCTGYGARALLDDDSIIPVRGQTAKLIPQPEVDWGLNYGDRRVSVYPRRDGLLVQAQADTDFNNDAENLDPQESISAVNRLAEIIAGMGNPTSVANR
jgi:glycine/D-amino acid oxidase-like deaminating enzyme